MEACTPSMNTHVVVPKVTGETLRKYALEEYEHFKDFLGHRGAVRRLAEVYRVTESYIQDIVVDAGVVSSNEKRQ